MRCRALVSAALAAVCLLATVHPAAASPATAPDPTAPVTGPATTTSPGGGTVYSIAQAGDRTIIGGEFTSVGGLTRSGLAALLPDGTVDASWDPVLDGIVNAVAVSEDGTTVFVGGTFLTVDGVPRTRVAALDAATGEVRPDWSADANDTVNALAVEGTRLYVGGRFTGIDGTTLRRLAAIDTTSGNPVTAFRPRPNWTVRAVTVSPDGTKVYAVGGFDTIGGQPRVGAAELLATDGTATAFAPVETGFTLAAAVSTDGSKFLYSTANNRTYVYEPAVSSTPLLTVQTSGDVQAIAVSSSGEVYIGGHFGQVGPRKIKRARLASFDLSTGAVTAWNPGVTNSYMGVWALQVDATRVHVGGDFQRVNGQVRRGFARFTGTP